LAARAPATASPPWSPSKATVRRPLSDTTGQIIDLTEEKIYDLDVKKKTYTVTTFAELRRRMERAKRDAEKSVEKTSEPSKPAEKDPNAREYEVDFDMKNTGVSKNINGFDTKQTVVTITVREKGKTLNQSGGIVMTTDLWNAANAPSTKDLAEFDMKYAQKLYGPMVVGASAQDMAMAMAMYPQMKPGARQDAREGTKVQGTAILTDTKIESVPPGTANSAPAAAPAAEPAPKKVSAG
jgi:hypothetical protein